MLWSDDSITASSPYTARREDGSHMAKAPQQLGIGIRRHFTTAGTHPVRHRRVGAPRRADPELQGRRRRLLPARCRVPDQSWSVNATNIVAQKYFRGTLGTARARDVAAPGDRPRRRHDHRLGHQGRLLRRRRGSRSVPRRAEVHPRAPARRVQLAGVVQHRREGRAAAGERVLHPRRRRHDGRDPQLVPGRGDRSSRAVRARA